MSSQRRIEASRRNGALSRGPATAEGKRRSSRNAQRHGLLSGNTLHEGDNRDRYLELIATFTAEFHPASPIEHTLIEEMAAARWNVIRTLQYSKTRFDLEMKKPEIEAGADLPSARAALAYRSLCENGSALTAPLRYETTYQRRYERALNYLLYMRQNRRGEAEMQNMILRNEPSPISGHSTPVPAIKAAATHEREEVHDPRT